MHAHCDSVAPASMHFLFLGLCRGKTKNTCHVNLPLACAACWGQQPPRLSCLGTLCLQSAWPSRGVYAQGRSVCVSVMMAMMTTTATATATTTRRTRQARRQRRTRRARHTLPHDHDRYHCGDHWPPRPGVGGKPPRAPYRPLPGGGTPGPSVCLPPAGLYDRIDRILS